MWLKQAGSPGRPQRQERCTAGLGKGSPLGNPRLVLEPYPLSHTTLSPNCVQRICIWASLGQVREGCLEEEFGQGLEGRADWGRQRFQEGILKTLRWESMGYVLDSVFGGGGGGGPMG